jgi:hypothetical protein
MPNVSVHLPDYEHSRSYVDVLTPCPFCRAGGTDLLVCHISRTSGRESWQIGCTICGGHGPEDSTTEGALHRWNDRG